MRTEHLMYFVDLAQSGALSKTAEKYYTSHQVIKKAISSLEDELCVNLIRTTNQGATLTPAGEIVLQYAKEVLALETDVKAALQPYTAEALRSDRKSLRLYITPYLTDSLVLNFVYEYQARNPEIRLQLVSLPFVSILPRIKTADSVLIIPTCEDAATAVNFSRELEKYDLCYTVLTKRPLYVCVNAKSELARRETPLSEGEIFQLPVVIASNMTLNTVFVEMLHSQQANSIEAQKQLIKMGNCVGLFTDAEYRFYFKKERGFVLLPTELKPVWYICVRKRQAELPPHVQAFLRQLAEVF